MFRVTLTRSPGNHSQQNTENNRNPRIRERKHFLVTPFSVHTSNKMLFESLTQKPFWFNLGGQETQAFFSFSLSVSQSIVIDFRFFMYILYIYKHTHVYKHGFFSICHYLAVWRRLQRATLFQHEVWGNWFLEIPGSQAASRNNYWTMKSTLLPQWEKKSLKLTAVALRKTNEGTKNSSSIQNWWTSKNHLSVDVS